MSRQDRATIGLLEWASSGKFLEVGNYMNYGMFERTYFNYAFSSVQC